MILPSIINTAKICAALGVQRAVLSPGSRCAPLSIAFARHPDVQTYTLSDERSAAFVGLGMARQAGRPVVLVCTSGSAAYNYAPAVAEAFFQQVPLIVITADRPTEWIDQLDGQTIRQRGIYGQHVKADYELPVAHDQLADVEVWQASRQVSEAVNLSQAFPPGPVHINVPIREPFYTVDGDVMDFDQPVKTIRQDAQTPSLNDTQVEALLPSWMESKRKLIVCGQHTYSQPLAEALGSFSQEKQVPIVADAISNMHTVAGGIRHADVLLAQKDEKLLTTLQPDLLITFGLSVMSKNLKLYLRKFRPAQHWHIQPSASAADTYQSLSRVVHTSPLSFFQKMSKEGASDSTQRSYYQNWQSAEQKVRQSIDASFQSEDKPGEYGEFAAVHQVLEHLPEDCHLHLANSMAVRYTNIIGVSRPLEVFANRGTSGIDGSSSTAVGTALTSGKLTVLITGDLAFFYDRNAFWHNYKVPNLRIILLNNHGGGIFRMIDGPAQQPEVDEYFVTQQALTAENTARDFRLDYHKVDLHTQKELTRLKDLLPDFISQSGNHAKILEIITDVDINTRIYQRFKNTTTSNK